jgi:hypothetical protein
LTPVYVRIRTSSCMSLWNVVPLHTICLKSYDKLYSPYNVYQNTISEQYSIKIWVKTQEPKFCLDCTCQRMFNGKCNKRTKHRRKYQHVIYR